MNNIVIDGYLVKDMEVKTYKKEGKDCKYGTFTIAHNYSEAETAFITCVVLSEKQVEYLSKSDLAKGSLAAVSGELKVKYTKKEDKAYTNVSIIVKGVIWHNRSEKKELTHEPPYVEDYPF